MALTPRDSHIVIFRSFLLIISAAVLQQFCSTRTQRLSLHRYTSGNTSSCHCYCYPRCNLAHCFATRCFVGLQCCIYKNAVSDSIITRSILCPNVVDHPDEIENACLNSNVRDFLQHRITSNITQKSQHAHMTFMQQRNYVQTEMFQSNTKIMRKRRKLYANAENYATLSFHLLNSATMYPTIRQRNL